MEEDGPDGTGLQKGQQRPRSRRHPVKPRAAALLPGSHFPRTPPLTLRHFEVTSVSPGSSGGHGPVTTALSQTKVSLALPPHAAFFSDPHAPQT